MAKILWLCTLIVVPALGSIAQAQQYPTRPVRFVLGFPAGGPTDAAGRIIAQALGLGKGSGLAFCLGRFTRDRAKSKTP